MLEDSMAHAVLRCRPASLLQARRLRPPRWQFLLMTRMLTRAQSLSRTWTGAPTMGRCASTLKLLRPEQVRGGRGVAKSVQEEAHGRAGAEGVYNLLAGLGVRRGKKGSEHVPSDPTTCP